jgi:very-short-patch-repair endonuclease
MVFEPSEVETLISPMPYKRRRKDIHNLPERAQFRRERRRDLTSAEATLWALLKNSALDGRKFRRQHSVGRYILDFYCPAEKLAVELDGEDHFMPWGITYDNERKRYLNRVGINVRRFENRDVFQCEEWVLNEIRKEFGWRRRQLDERIRKRHSS